MTSMTALDMTAMAGIQGFGDAGVELTGSGISGKSKQTSGPTGPSLES